jgi:hypothetical protein
MSFKRSIFAIGLAVAGCTQQAQQSAAPAPQAPETPVIVRVVSRDLTISAHAGSDGPIYAVQSKDGETVVTGQTLPELQANEPTLARHIQAMQADTWAGLD